MNVIYPGNPDRKKKKTKEFSCKICGCIWEADLGEYSEDWTQHSIPAYCNCPTCGTKTYAMGTFKGKQSRS